LTEIGVLPQFQTHKEQSTQRSWEKQDRQTMGQQTSFHAPHGGADFLGWRVRAGFTEIVYDDGVARRIVWRVSEGAENGERLSEALRAAVGSVRVVSSLYDELKKRAIAIERIAY
jgi:hypothetical protein